MGFHEVDLFSKYKPPQLYFRYVDDTFSIYGSKTEADEFFSRLNNIHPALRFTLEKVNNSLYISGVSLLLLAYTFVGIHLVPKSRRSM